MSVSKLSVLFLGAALLFSVGACENEENGGVGVSVEQILDDPEAYYGSRVTVSGVVDDVYNATTFSITGGDAGEDLLVLSIDSIGAVPGRSVEEPVRARDIVQITGEVRQFAAADFSDEFGLDMGPVDDEFEDRPVVIARSASAQLPSLVVSPREGVVTPPTEEELVTDFQRVAGEKGRELVGRLAHFNDVRAARMVGDQSFWGTVEGADSLFISITPGAVETGVLDTTQAWEVYGILREVPPPTEVRAAWDVDEATIARLADESVFLQAIVARRSGSM